jgi:hypothetical protein
MREGDVQYHDDTPLELVDGEWRRLPAGWYVEVFRNGEWHRELGPFWDSLIGVPDSAVAAAKKAGLI